MSRFKQYEGVIRDTLIKFEELGGAAFSEDAVQLLLMLAAYESNMGKFIKQVGGPALGIFQMEPETHDDIWKNFILGNKSVNFAVAKFLPSTHSLTKKSDGSELLATDIRYATVMARAFFMRFKEPIPDSDYDKARYAKYYWNTEAGKATINDYFTAYRSLV